MSERWPELSFEDLIGTTRFDVHERAHITVDADICGGCSARECLVACPAKLFVADERRRHPLQLRTVLRVRHLLPRVQQGGRDHLDVSRGRPRRGLRTLVNTAPLEPGPMNPSPMKIAVCWKWVSIGDPGGPSSSDTRWAGVSAADEAALETALQLSDDGQGHGDRGLPRAAGGRRRAPQSDRRRSVASGTHRRFARARQPPRRHANSPAWSAGPTSSCAATSRSTAAPGRCPRSSPTNSAWRRHSACCEVAAAPTGDYDPAVSAPPRRRPARGARRPSAGRHLRRGLGRPAAPGVARLRSSGPRRRRSTSSRRSPTSTPTAAVVFAYRPRARVLPPPHGDVLDRVRGILDVGGAHTSHGDVVVLEPAAAARAHRRSARARGAICTSRQPRRARRADVRLGDATWREVADASRPGRSHRRREVADRADPGGLDRTTRPAPAARHRHADRRGARRPGDPPDRRADGRPDDLGHARRASMRGSPARCRSGSR